MAAALLDAADALLDEDALEEAELEDVDFDELDVDVLADAVLADADELPDEAELDEFAEHEQPAKAAMQTTSANAAAITSAFFILRSPSSNDLPTTHHFTKNTEALEAVDTGQFEARDMT